jgi:phospholipase C
LPDAAPLIDAASGGDAATGAPKIAHIFIIMQENRSFDTYFGTFPGAEGLPVSATGAFTTCSPDPMTSTCVYPFHNSVDANGGGPHGAAAFTADLDNGKMDGFVAQQEAGANCATGSNNPMCSGSAAHDAMGYKDAHEIPNYWAYAGEYVLLDHLFEPAASWSLPAHLYLTSAWSALCTVAGDPTSCKNNLNLMVNSGNYDYAWTDVTYLLHKHGISWKYYLAQGTEPDCDDGEMECAPITLTANVPSIWNPLPQFDTVKMDGEVGNVVPIDQFYVDAKADQLPQVVWIMPEGSVSEHPPALTSDGEKYVTGVINTIMQSPAWSSSVIILAWDDWGGFYDHVVPPKIDGQGYGFRVPGMLISPFAKKGASGHGLIDHQTLSFDAFLKLIEDVYMNGERIDPMTDGRPDPRPTVRENARQLGDLRKDLDLQQAPRSSMVLPQR